MIKLFPKCKTAQNFGMGITYDGYVAPCCVMAGPNFQQIKNLLGDKVEQLHISNGSMDTINSSEAALLIEQSFTTNPMITCTNVCRSPIMQDETAAAAGSKLFTITRDM